jgi:hypothetical protein
MPTTTVATVTEVTSDDLRPEADVISPSGWRRWPLDGDVFGSAGVWDLVAGGDGFVAVGTTLVTCETPGRVVGGVDTSSEAAVWTSSDGTSWRRVSLDDALSRGTSLWKVASSGAGLVAIGRDTSRDLPVVWNSPDGIAWSPVTDEDFQDADIHLADVAATSHGFTVVGDEGEDVTTAAVWTSADGLSWTRVPLDEDSSNRASMRALTSSGDQVLAVGILRDDPAHFALWSSTDATAWTLTEVPVGDLGDNDAIGIVAANSGIVVSSYGGVWHSPDGESWSSTSFESLEAEGGCDGDGLQVFDLATAGTEFTATGYRCESTGMVAAVWTSPDGANWSITSDNSETFAGGITTLEPAGSGLIAFGSDPLEPDGPDNPASTNTVLWTNIATDPTATQTTTTDSP